MRLSLTSTVFIAAQLAVPAGARVSPSFQYDGELTATEWAICEDAELSAHDTAMAFAYAHRWRPPLSERISQRDWLAKRNACGRDRECIRMAYRSWIDGLMSAPRSAQILERVGEVDDHGADLLLANVRSFGRRSAPAGSVTILGDDGSLFIRALGGDWYFFRIEAAHFYDPHDGRGPNATDSYAVGVAHLPNGKGVWREAPEEPASCTIEFTRLRAGAWQIAEPGAYCSGTGSTLSGTYRRRR